MTTVTAPKRATKALTMKQWAEIETIWEAGMMTRKTLAEKYKVAERTIQKHMSEKKIVRGSKVPEHRDMMEKELVKASIDDASILAARIRETKEDHYKMVSGLGKLTWAEVLKAKQDGAPISVAMNNLKALDAAISNLAKVRAEKWAILGLDKDTYIDEDGLPELVISELTADQVQALRDRDHTEFDDLPEDANQGDNDIDDEDSNGVVEE